MHGVDAETIERGLVTWTRNRELGASVDVDIRLADGETLDVGSAVLRVLHVPGHSPTDTLFVDESARLAFGGDHLLESASNALVAERLPGTPPLGRGRRAALAEYLASLRRTRELDLDTVLPGHGMLVADHRAAIDERLRRAESRLDRIRNLLMAGPGTAHELARAMWGDRAPEQPYLTLSETLGHLDLLVDRALVHEHDDGRIVQFALAG
jgi:glyoxylase-like metal-dependent hydrolase (beta-lactamase superfamily II)